MIKNVIRQHILPSFVQLSCLLVLSVPLVIANTPSPASGYNAKKIIFRSPIGDGIHTDVYFFITDSLLKEKHLSRKKLRSILAGERKIHAHNKSCAQEEILKPRSATVREGELASILAILRDHYSGYEELTLYQKQGLELASSGGKNNINFIDNLDEDYQLGYLGENPADWVGIRKITSIQGEKYYHVVQFINYNPKQKFSYLSFSSPQKGHQVLGYLSYIVKEGAI